LVNAGTGLLQLTSIAAAAPFSETNNCGASLVPRAGCTIHVSFKPSATGSSIGALTFKDNAGTQSVSLSGIGSSVAPTVTVSPASLWFPSEQVSTKSAGQTVTLANYGKSAIALSGVAVAGDFVETTTCGTSRARRQGIAR
jgi:hypothetical protein